jgi:hypothetical protein
MTRIEWEALGNAPPGPGLPALPSRCRVPGGWLVYIQPFEKGQNHSLTYVPDPDHEWDPQRGEAGVPVPI